MQPNGTRDNAYTPLLSNFLAPEEIYREFDLQVPDDKLHKLIITSLNEEDRFKRIVEFEKNSGLSKTHIV